MLGKYVKVKIITPIDSIDASTKQKLALNFGEIITNVGKNKSFPRHAYIMGMDHPVHHFDGRVIAVIHCKNNPYKNIYVVAPKNRRFIINDIQPVIEKMMEKDTFSLECLYELSCGAVIFHGNGEARKFLLIKNNRSVNWGYPKGHIEPGETKEEAALREVKEETGLDIEIINGFSAVSSYSIHGRIEKEVIIFVGKAKTDDLLLQEEEIERGQWFKYRDALRKLRFENDKSILRRVYRFLKRKKI